LSNSSTVLAVGQSQSISITGGSSASYYISSISNPSAVTVNLSGSQLNLTGVSAGSGTISLCQTGNSTCATLTVTVNTAGSATSTPVTFSTTSLPPGTVGQNYSYQLQAQGGLGSYTYFLPSGSLPAGLTLSTGGLISGTPTVATTSSFTLEVSDSGGTSQNSNFSITVNSASVNIPAPAADGAYANGQLINENGTIAIVYKNTKSPFANAAAFLGLGFSFSNVQTVSNSGLALSGRIVVTASGAHPRGSWLTSGSTVYFITPTGLIPVPSWAIFLSNGGQASFLVKANSYDLAFPKLPLMVSGDARLK
jgi:hypothetical protein